MLHTLEREIESLFIMVFQYYKTIAGALKQPLWIIFI